MERGGWPTNTDARTTEKGRILSPSSDSVEVAPASASNGLDKRRMLEGAQAFFTSWRLVELWSDQGFPWEAFIQWTGGQAGGARLTLTVMGSARVCIAAHSIATIEARNLSSETQVCRAAISTVDGPIACQNHWMLSQVGGGIGGGLPFDIIPPRFAERLYMTPSIAASLAGTTVDLYDGLGNLCGNYTLNNQPPYGQPVVGISKVTVTPVAGTRYQCDFTLGV